MIILYYTSGAYRVYTNVTVQKVFALPMLTHAIVNSAYSPGEQATGHLAQAHP